MKKLAMAVSAMLAVFAVPAAAAPITYTFTGEFGGTLNGASFDVPATFTGIGDTAAIQNNGFSNYEQLVSLSAVANGVTYTVTEPTFFYINSNGYAGLEFGAFNDTSYFSGQNDSLVGYDGVSSVATTPITYFDGIDATFSTDQGAVEITSASGGTFAASVTGAVPEPATWAMMLMGFGMVGFGLRYQRKQSVRATFA